MRKTTTKIKTKYTFDVEKKRSDVNDLTKNPLLCVLN